MDLATLLSKLDTLSSLSTGQLSAYKIQILAAFDTAEHQPRSESALAAMRTLADAHVRVAEEMDRRSNRAPASDSAAAFNATQSPARVTARPAATSMTMGTGRGLVTDRFNNEISDRDGLAQALTAALNDAKSGRPGVAFKADWKAGYDEDRRLTGDALHDTAKLDKQRALVASGGVCNPVNVDYSVNGIAVTDRPLRDGLPGFLADRGGLRFTTPVQLASTAGATGIWTEATDANPNGATKPKLTLTCPTENELFVDAISSRIGIGNMQGRFYPEWVENFTSTVMAAAARTAELNLLSKIATGSTSVSSGQTLGTARDLVATLDQVVAAARYRQRAGDQAPWTVILPSWAKSMIRADLAREAAHDIDGGDPLAVTDARIMAWFAARAVTPIWTLDASPAVTGGAGRVPFVSQQLGFPTAGAALNDWPHQLVWFCYPSGTWEFLDGGILNVGIVRDSTLDATNDYEVFTESFENVAFRGLESLQVVSTVRPNGGSAAGVNTTAY